MQNINVNIVPDNFPQTIRYSQGDIGRQFKINVTDFDIPVGATVKIQATKPSGFGFSVAGVVSDNSVTFTTTEEMTDEAGRFQAELQITAGGDVIGTANFLMIGERNPHPEGTTDGSQGTIIPELTLLVERVEKAASDILDMNVEAETLPAGSQAGFSYDEDTNTATFFIPEGQAGAGAAGVVASAYSAAKTYKVGDYVLYNSNLYRCTTAITTAEAWTAAHWTQVVLADDVTDLKSDFTDISDETRNLNTKGCGRYVINGSNGSITYDPTNLNTFAMGGKIPCKPSTDYVAQIFDANLTSGTIYVHFYDVNGDYLSNVSYNVSSNPYTVLAFTSLNNAYYTAIRAYKSGLTLGDNPRIQIEEGIIPSPYIAPIGADDVDIRETYNNIISELSKDILFTTNAGYIGSDGTINSQSSTSKEVYTNKIDVTKISRIYFDLSLTEKKALWVAYAEYNQSGAFIQRVVMTPQIQPNTNKAKGFIDVASGVSSILISYRTYDIATMSLSVLESVGKTIDDLLSIDSRIVNGNLYRSSIGSFPCRFKPFYDHLFIEKINGNNVIIPSESLFNIQISRRLGFNMIEANVQPTSDGNYIVMHGESGKFGSQVEHIDGETDISNTSINSVTLAWIQANVRYKCLYPKYRVAPPTLEEFLYECKKNCMTVLVTASDINALKIINDIMGKDNYVAYNGTRATTNAPIMGYKSLTTKEEILAECNSFGVPYMYCMANPTAFTDTEITEIVELLHSNGYWIGYAGCYLNEIQSQRLMALGFDFCASNYQINEFETGNICNLNGDVDYTDFHTNGTDNNGVLTLATDQIIEPDPDNIPTVFLGGGSLHIRFNGKIGINMGNFIIGEIESDGSQSLWFSTYYLNNKPTFYISAVTNTEILNIDFKASKM